MDSLDRMEIEILMIDIQNHVDRLIYFFNKHGKWLTEDDRVRIRRLMWQLSAFSGET